MKTIFAGIMLSLSSLAHANIVTVPIAVHLDKVFSAGTNTYMSMIGDEIEAQIAQVCGAKTVLQELDIHYTVVQGQTGFDVSKVTALGSAKCPVTE